MAIDWINIKGVITTLIADISGLGPTGVKWQDEAEGGMWVVDPAVFLRISSVVGIGVEEERRSESLGNDQVVDLVGQRQFTLSIRAESFEQNIASPRHASTVIENIKTRLIRTSTIEQYSGIFSIRDYMDAKWFNYTNQGRQVSAYVFDLICLTVNSDIDNTLGAGSWINEVLVRSNTINGVDGLPLPEQINLDIVGS